VRRLALAVVVLVGASCAGAAAPAASPTGGTPATAPSAGVPGATTTPVLRPPIKLPPLPPQGIVVGDRGGLSFVDLHGDVVARVRHFRLYFQWAVPGSVIVRQHRSFFVLRIGAHALQPLASERAASQLAPQFQEGVDPLAGKYLDLPRPAGAPASGGFWTYSIRSPEGSRSLAQWSGECEVPAAYFVTGDGSFVRPVIGGPNLSDVPESRGLGWTADGRAVVHVMAGLCGSGMEPGVYLFQGSGHGELLVSMSEKASVRMWGTA